VLLHWVSLFILAFAVSLDGFGVGVMYGLRKIKIPLLSVAIISCCSGVIIFASMQIGVLLLQFISPDYAKAVGAVILIGIGCWALIQMLRNKGEDQEVSAPGNTSDAKGGEPVEHTASDSGINSSQTDKTVLHIELKRLGLVIQILRTPSIADVDRSGTISASEATLLGLALSLDAFGAGIGAALLGFSPLLTSAVIALASGTFIWVGLRIGFLFSGFRWMRRLSIVPGCVLILMGIMKLF